MRSSLRWLPLLVVILGVPVLLADEDKKISPDELLNKRAPEIAGDFVVEGKPILKLADLKGKVVLLNFWAVWSRPSRECFDRLRTLQREYRGDLVIVGLTSYSGDTIFSTETGKVLVLSKKLSAVEEQSTLTDFSRAHKLNYQVQAVPEQEMRELTKAYQVNHVPQMVLIDRKGIIRMIKVGAGDAKFDDLAKKIKELVGD